MRKLLILFFCFGLFIAAVSSQVLITEIMYNPPEPGTDTLEYIELYNAGSGNVNLSGWQFSSPITFTFPDITLGPGQYLVICRNEAYFQQLFGSIPVLQWTSGALSNSGSMLTLFNAAGSPVTTVSYTNTGPWPGGKANGNGASIVLCDLIGGQNDPANWKAAQTATGIFHYGVELLANPNAASGCLFPNEKGLLLTGVFDAQPQNAGAKGVEIYVIKDIPDLSRYGLGSANNGGGTNGVEFSFPAVPANNGSFLYIAVDSALFNQFFGFDAHYITNAMNINGDDAIELFEFGTVIDVFGDIHVDGTGQPWEYLDGWAYRVDGTGPDGSNFILQNWYFSGVGGLTGSPTNQGAPKPFPIGTYQPPNGQLKANDDIFNVEMNVQSDLNVLANDQTPQGITTFELVDTPQFGLAAINGNLIIYQPGQNFCGLDELRYRICDASICDTATVSITVQCPSSYPAYPIGLVRTVDAQGVLDSAGVKCQLEGVVYGVNLRPGGLQFVMIDDANDGITVFSMASLGYSPEEGDRIIVRGEIAQFNGLAQMQPVEIELVDQNQPLFPATIVMTLSEETESQLIKIENVSIVDPSEWTNAGAGFNVRLTNGVDEFIMRIDNDVNVYGTTPPSGTFHITGLGTQFSSTAPFLDGYQIMPRYLKDLDLGSSVHPVAGSAKYLVWPNPSVSGIFIQGADFLTSLTMFDMLGKSVKDVMVFPIDEHTTQVIWGQIATGQYVLQGWTKSEGFLQFLVTVQY